MAIDQKLLGQGIRRIRKLRGLTQADLARAAGLAEGGNSVALIERGERGVSLESLNAIARGLEVPAGCLSILGTTAPAHDRDLKRLVKSAKNLVEKVVRLHAAMKAKTEEKKHRRITTRKTRLRSNRTPRKRSSAA
jgi:transcriptional regulator with XRE-family HTH domain